MTIHYLALPREIKCYYCFMANNSSKNVQVAKMRFMKIRTEFLPILVFSFVSKSFVQT